jgi:hypothetical protein
MPTWRRALIAIVALCLLAPTPTAARGQDMTPAAADPFCDALVALVTDTGPDVEFHEDMTDAEMAEATEITKAYAEEDLLPVIDDLAAASPEELVDEVATLHTFAERAAETGELDDVSPELESALEALNAYGAESCEWNDVTVTAVDYAFENVPKTLEAGVTRFTLVNTGTEIHEMVLFRVNDGVSLSLEELLALPEEEVFGQITFSTYATAPPGQSGSGVGNLTPGRYILLCFIPVGTTSLDASPAPGAHVHVEEGMVLEVTAE